MRRTMILEGFVRDELAGATGERCVHAHLEIQDESEICWVIRGNKRFIAS